MLGSESQAVVAATQQPEESGQLSDTSVVATEQRAESGQLSDTSGAATQQPAETRQLPDTSAAVERGSPREEVEAEEVRPAPPPTFVEPDQEIEIAAETDTHGSSILSFQPLNPENSPERRAVHYLPMLTSTPARDTVMSQVKTSSGFQACHPNSH